MVQLVIFDCDGVLVESEALAFQCELEGLRELGHTLDSQVYQDLSLGRRAEKVTQLLWEQHQIVLPADFWVLQAERLRQMMQQELVAVEGVVETVKGLSLPTCIASSSDMAHLKSMLGQVGLWSHFEGRVFSTQMVQHPKPAPDVYLHAAAVMGAEPSECLVIEDSPVGIQAGLAAGMTVLAFGGGRHITPNLKERIKSSGAHGYFERMQELPGLIP
jgi:HAD superfamily hydrolase (TIGR01509 family)